MASTRPRKLRRALLIGLLLPSSLLMALSPLSGGTAFAAGRAQVNRGYRCKAPLVIIDRDGDRDHDGDEFVWDICTHHIVGQRGTHMRPIFRWR